VGGPQISFANQKSANFADLFFSDLQTFRKCGNLRICDFGNIYFLRCANLLLANPIIFCGLINFTNPQIHNFSPYKCKVDFWLLDQKHCFFRDFTRWIWLFWRHVWLVSSPIRGQCHFLIDFLCALMIFKHWKYISCARLMHINVGFLRLAVFVIPGNRKWSKIVHW
jgi:hypothetical protein